MRGRHHRLSALAAIAALILSSCGGGGGGGGGSTPTPGPTTPTPTSLYTAPAQEALTVADVETVVAHAVAEARARNLPAVIAVTARVGNVRSEERRVGKEGVSTCRLRGSPYH